MICSNPITHLRKCSIEDRQYVDENVAHSELTMEELSAACDDWVDIRYSSNKRSLIYIFGTTASNQMMYLLRRRMEFLLDKPTPVMG